LPRAVATCFSAGRRRASRLPCIGVCVRAGVCTQLRTRHQAVGVAPKQPWRYQQKTATLANRSCPAFQHNHRCAIQPPQPDLGWTFTLHPRATLHTSAVVGVMNPQDLAEGHPPASQQRRRALTNTGARCQECSSSVQTRRRPIQRKRRLATLKMPSLRQRRSAPLTRSVPLRELLLHSQEKAARQPNDRPPPGPRRLGTRAALT
jgi:hypothetical protein